MIDADDRAPLTNAILYLEQRELNDDESSNGARPIGEREEGESDLIRGSRMALTDSMGAYAFTNLDPGSYKVHVRHPGYKGASLDVELVGTSSAILTVGLDFRPVNLQTVQVEGLPAEPFRRTATPGAEVVGARRFAVRSRQEEFLSSDTRSLTAGEVVEAVTLAEPDLFRALQRVPGVGRRDDYTAVLWTRGAPWVHTRVYFDGLPLFNPTHGGWLFSSINPDGVGSAVFHPGVRPAELGEGAAAVLDLSSRNGSRTKRLEARADISLASARIGLNGSIPGGATWMIAARRTYVDLLTSTWDAIGTSADPTYIPYDFSDVISRVEIPLVAGIQVEASGIVEGDRLRGDIPRFSEGNRADWGNRAGQVTIRLPIGPLRINGSMGGTHFSSDVEEVDLSEWMLLPLVPRDRSSTGPGGAGNLAERTTIPEMESFIAHDRRSIKIEGTDPSGLLPGWNVGAEWVRESLSYDGPFSFLGEGIVGVPRELRIPFQLSARNQYTGYWGDLRWNPINGLEAQGGVRIEVGDSLRNGDRRRISPRVAIRWTPYGQTGVSAGWGRSYQYTQSIGASAGPLGPQLHLSNLWVMAGLGYPALRSEIVTLGVETWIGSRWLLTANTYFREVSGVTEPDPTPGPLQPDASHVEVTNHAKGLELSVRRLVGRTTLSGGYSYGRSEMRNDDFRYPSSADIRHSFDLTGTYRVSESLRLGAAFSVASGIPFTRIVVDGIPQLEEPNAERTPAYASLDIMVGYSGDFRGAQVMGYIQLMNALGSRNAVTYSGSRTTCPTATPPDVQCEAGMVVDNFDRGLPRLPLIGLSVAF